MEMNKKASTPATSLSSNGMNAETEKNDSSAAVDTVSAAAARPRDTDSEDYDPVREQSLYSHLVKEDDTVLLHFADGRQIFAKCCHDFRGKKCPVRINKKSYPTFNLIGVPYGTVLEQGLTKLEVLPPGELLLPRVAFTSGEAPAENSTAPATNEDEKESVQNDHTKNQNSATLSDQNSSQVVVTNVSQPQNSKMAMPDNRDLEDSNKAQTLSQQDVIRLKLAGTTGAKLIEKIIENSKTFQGKTNFSKAKYIARKQMKHQPRCRIVRCTPATVCEALFLKDPRRVMNLRHDTLGQILSHANLYAGCQALVFDTCMGVVTGSVAQRLGGYGKVLSLYTGQQPSCSEPLRKFNLSFAENAAIKWLHVEAVFGAGDEGDPALKGADATTEERDLELEDRQRLKWPCELQQHTREFMKTMKTIEEKKQFLAKRAARFARKLTRHTPMEANKWLHSRPCDSVILVANYDPTETLLAMLPFLAPSCPFVVYSEYIEPLTQCFQELQKQKLGINLRLSTTWTREWQVLPGRTHPNMNMSQSGGFILVGTKLDPETGNIEMDEEVMKNVRAQIGTRRKRERHSAREAKRRKLEKDKSKDT